MAVSERELTSLAATHDIISLGMLADDLRQQRHQKNTTFVRVADVPVEPGPVAIPAAAGEVRIVGGPASRSAAIDRVRDVVQQTGGKVLSGFSLADLEELSGRERVTLRSLLEELHAAGLELVAEAPFDRLKDVRRSIEEVNISGLALARLTIHKSPSADPLPRRVNPAAPTTGYDDVKHVALARVVVDNIPSIQVDWSLYGPKLAQVALTVGADDVDGVSPEEEAPEGRRRAPLEEIRRNIRAAGQEPVERNGRFERLVP
jgi:hypothetical protein